MLNEENITALYDIIDDLVATYNIQEEDVQALETALEAVLYPDIESDEDEYDEDYEEDLDSLEYEDEE